MKDSRGQAAGPWCNSHRPGPRKKRGGNIDLSKALEATSRRSPPKPLSARAVIAFRETMIGKMLPVETYTWPPVARLLELRPGQRNEIGLRHIAIALMREGITPHVGHWQRCLAMLQEHGWMKPEDPPLPPLLSDHWEIAVQEQHL